jgi:uncharacterized membrane protein HdeD (DUF308 family)
MTAPRPGPRPGTAPTDQPHVPRQQGPAPAEGTTAPAEGTTSAEGTTTARPGEPARPGGPGGPVAGERMMPSRLESLGRRSWQAILGVAILLVAVGVILVAWPRATLIIVAILLGAGLVISGVYRFIEGIANTDISGGTRAAYIVIGLLAIFVGLYCLRHHDVSIFLLALLVGAFWIMHGFTDLAVAASSAPRAGRGWLVASGIVGIAAGAVVLFWPGISLLVLLLVLGIWLIFYGLVLAGLAYHLRRATKRITAGGRAAATA